MLLQLFTYHTLPNPALNSSVHLRRLCNTLRGPAGVAAVAVVVEVAAAVIVLSPNRGGVVDRGAGVDIVDGCKKQNVYREQAVIAGRNGKQIAKPCYHFKNSFTFAKCHRIGAQRAGLCRQAAVQAGNRAQPGGRTRAYWCAA